MVEFRMPSLGADMDVGTIVEWRVAPGDTVHHGDVVAVVDTAKAAIEIEVFTDGVVTEILVGTGVEVAVGTPLALIEPAAEGARRGPARGPVRPEAPSPTPAAAPAPVPAPTRVARVATPPVRHLAHQLGVDVTRLEGSGRGGAVTRQDVLRAAGGTAPGERVRATPRARHMAAESGVDLGLVTGSGPAGAVTGADVAAATTATPGPVPGPPVPGPTVPGPTVPGPTVPGPTVLPRAADEGRRAAMRSAIATLMSRSAAEIPHYYVSQTVDVSGLLGWLRTRNASRPVTEHVLPVAALLRAVVVAAVAVPGLNGHWVDGAFVPGDGIHLSVAVATRGGGLVTPTIRDAGALDLDRLMAGLADLVRRARRGTLRQGEMAPGTITVSSLGEDGPDALFGVIYPPQVALVGIGGIVERPWAVSGMLTVRPTVTVTLSADHRASDGRTGASFLAALSHALARPAESLT